MLAILSHYSAYPIRVSLAKPWCSKFSRQVWVGGVEMVHDLALVASQANELSILQRARDALAAATTIEDVREIHDQAEAARVYARSAAMGLEVQNHAAEIKLRAERKAGELLAQTNLRGGDRRCRSRRRKQTLADIGITQQQSYRWQVEASVPDDAFEEYIALCKTLQREMTSAAVLRIACRSRTNGRDVSLLPSIAQVKLDIETRIKAGAQYRCIYMHPPWPQRTYQKPPIGSSTDDGLFSRQLTRLSLRALGTDSSHLHLQSPYHWLAESIKLIQKWGYTYRAALPLVSNHGTFGPYWRMSCDCLLLGVRGNLRFRKTSAMGWLDGASEREVTELIAQVSPGPYLQLFATDSYTGWSQSPGVLGEGDSHG